MNGNIVLIDSYNVNNFKTKIIITGDGKEIYSNILTPDILPIMNLNIDVSGVDILNIHMYDLESVAGGTAFGLSDFCLSKDATKKQATNKIKIIINNKEISFKQPPYIENGTTMVPMRAIFEALGVVVDYDASTKSITAHKGNTVIELVTDSTVAKVNGKTSNLPFAVANKNGSTMIPLRFVSEALGADVEWDNENKVISIYTITEEDELYSARQMLGNVFKNNKDFLFNDDQLLYKLMYKEMYVDNLSGNIVDKFAEYVTDNEVNEEKYMEILTTLLTVSDMEFNSAVYNQSEFDSNKSYLDYAFDVYDIISGTISPESQSKGAAIKQTLNLTKKTAQVTADSIDKAKIINSIGSSTEYKMEILNAIYSNTDDKDLKSAVEKIKQGMSGTALLELDIVNNSSMDLSKYIGDNIVLKDILIPQLKESDIYKSDETVKFFVDNSSEVYQKAKSGLGAFSTGTKLGLFAGDMILDTTDSVNDVTSIKAIYTISQSLEANLAQVTKNITSYDIDELKILTAKYNFLTYVHLRGEYIAYNLVTKDQKLFSLFFISKRDEIDKIMNIHVEYLSQINKMLNNDVFI